MRLMFLGDIHGQFNLINHYVDKLGIKDTHIIQVGDFGVGFNTLDKEKRMLELYHKKLVKNNVFVWAIRGNHDFKPYFDNDPFNLSNIKLVPDYEILNLQEKNILCIGGAVSVDRKIRYTNRQKNGDFETLTGVESWWPDEVFTLDKDKLNGVKNIDIIVTHTAPTFCPIDNTFGFGPFVEGMIRQTGDIDLKSDLLFERFQMDEVFEILKNNGNNIKNHYYGHFHRSAFVKHEGIKHRLLNIGELWEERE